tara:strand:- start:407 stop:967 length:561 start_codon:yes stop_codon:yes gene_type:complete
MKKILSIAAVTAIATAITAPANAQSHKMKDGMHRQHGDQGKHVMKAVRVESAWARATPGKAKNGGAYLTVVNGGKSSDRLVAVKGDLAKRVEIHAHLMDNGVMRMRRVEGINLPAGAKIMMKPGGYHVMFIGLHRPLMKGGSFPITLVFEKAGEIQVMVKVGSVGAMKPNMHEPGHKMGTGGHKGH